MLLAIDTSAGTSVAVTVDGRVLAERSSADTRRHAEVIGTLISECLDAGGAAVSDLTGVVAGMGPGPFTGLRVGIAAAVTFALGAGVPVHRVVSHDAIALARFALPEATAGPLLVVTDARRREVYWSAYDGVDDLGLPVRTAPAGLVRPDDLAHTIDSFDRYDRFERLDSETVPAGALGLLASALLSAGRPFAGSEPLYLRAPDAVASTGSKRVSQ